MQSGVLSRIFLVALFCVCTVFAQRDLSTLAGTVNDTSGGVVANAAVKITDSGLTFARTASLSGSPRRDGQVRRQRMARLHPPSHGAWLSIRRSPMPGRFGVEGGSWFACLCPQKGR